MVIPFDDALLTGNPEIDAQHREIFARLNALLAANASGAGAAELVVFFDFLVEYVVTHFRMEEALMVELRYDWYFTHKKEHDDFWYSCLKALDAYLLRGTSEHLSQRVADLVVAWANDHIFLHDTRLARHARDMRG